MRRQVSWLAAQRRQKGRVGGQGRKPGATTTGAARCQPSIRLIRLTGGQPHGSPPPSTMAPAPLQAHPPGGRTSTSDCSRAGREAPMSLP